jgi:gentisate 1,2-dioxygenase
VLPAERKIAGLVLPTPLGGEPRHDDQDQPVRTPELVALHRGFESELLVPLCCGPRSATSCRRTRAPVPYRTCGAGRTCCGWPSGPVSSCPWGAAGSAVSSRWPTRVPAAGPSPRRPSERRSSASTPREDAPVHRHIQHAFRFVVEGEGVWTVVNGDPVAMRRGDFLPQAGWNLHGHQNVSDRPMAWIDGLDTRSPTTPAPRSSSSAPRPGR